LWDPYSNRASEVRIEDIGRLRDGLQEALARNCNPGSSPDDSNNQKTISAPIVGPTEGLVNLRPETTSSVLNQTAGANETNPKKLTAKTPRRQARQGKSDIRKTDSTRNNAH
jgi:hypothetical protein